MRYRVERLTLVLAAGMVAAWMADGSEWRAASALGGDKKAQEIVRVRVVPQERMAALSAKSGTIELEYLMPALKVAGRPAGLAETGQTSLILGNAPQVGDPGKPVLPVVPCYVAIPKGKAMDTIQVECGRRVDLPGRHAIRHGEKAIPLVPGAKAEPVDPDPVVYGSDEPWPGKRYEYVTVQKKRGATVLVVNLNPVVYRPKSGRVSYYPSMRLKVKTRAALPREQSTAAYRPDRIRPVSEQVDNPETLKTYKANPERVMRKEK